MKYSWITWFEGYLNVSISGRDKERFITLCKNNNLRIFRLYREDDKYVFSMKIEDYKKIKKVVRKTHVIPIIRGKCGFPFLCKKHKKNKSLIFGMMLGMTLFYVASLYVWNITIEGENYYTDYEIIKYLKSKNISTGMRIKDVNCVDIERSLRKKYNEIGWASVRVEGTYMIIKIKENIIMDKGTTKSKDKNKFGVHILANNDGILKSVVAREGDVLVSKGDKVKKNDILISGLSTVLDENGKEVGKRAVHADGDIIIEYDKRYRYKCNRKYIDRVYTGRKIKGVIVRSHKSEILDTKYFPLLTKKFDNYDVIVNNYNVVVCKNMYIPISIDIKKQLEYIEIEKEYTDEELKQNAKDAYEGFKKNLENKNMECIGMHIKDTIDNYGIDSKGYVTVRDKNIIYKKEKTD